jgi:hypothetical protein
MFTKDLSMKQLHFFLLASLLSAPEAIAQSTITPTGPTVVAPTAASGRSTENLSVTNGSRTSLTVGNNTSFGTSANISASDGVTSISRSVLAPSSVTIGSNIGLSPTALGSTKINISNLTAKGGGTISPGGTGGVGTNSVINSTDGQYASGVATIDGMQATVDMKIGASPADTTTTGTQAGFFSVVHPNISGAACNPTPTNPCSYANINKLVSGNSTASANLSTQTNIDIQANSFTQTFAQSF